ncbi:hypothetical protein [Photobacterium damselae]|uniref:hypothetical protein n=1 Tax=Photobacterium damselae TaxID=38293 RepID=UPI0040689043
MDIAKTKLPRNTPDAVIAWYVRASGYFTCVNLDALDNEASESDIREAFEEDQCMLESICTQLNALVTTNPYD